MSPAETVAWVVVAVLAGLVAVLLGGWWLTLKPSVEEMADPGFNPVLDRSEAALREALEWQADRDDERRGLS